MRRRDKLKNIVRANMLAEQRYLRDKGLITEALNVDLDNFSRNTLKPALEKAGFQVRLFMEKDEDMVMAKVAENPKLVGIIWKDGRGDIAQLISLRFNRASKSKIDSILSKFSLASMQGQTKETGWGDKKTAQKTYNDGDLAIVDDGKVHIWIGRMKKLAEQRHLESKGVLTEGIIDTVKDKLTGPINDLIDKLGDKGQEVYNKLVDRFGENPSIDTIKAKIQSELNEDRDFGNLGMADDPKYADKEGKQNTTDKIMGILSQIMGLNVYGWGFPLGIAITVILGLPAIPGLGFGTLIGLIISLIIKGLADRYGRARAKQLDEDSLSEGRTTSAEGVVFSHLSDIPLDKANVRKRAEFIKFIIDKCGGDLNKDIDPDALWTEFSEEFTDI